MSSKCGGVGSQASIYEYFKIIVFLNNGLVFILGGVYLDLFDPRIWKISCA